VDGGENAGERQHVTVSGWGRAAAGGGGAFRDRHARRGGARGGANTTYSILDLTLAAG